jgi:hypothetical protein
LQQVKTKLVKWHPKNNKIYQLPTEGIEYALISDDYEQVHQLVWCKDFIQDAIHSFINKKKITIHGFSYDPDVDRPISMKRTRLMVTNWRDEQFGKQLQEGVLPLIHEVEDRLKMSRTILQKCKKVPPRYARPGAWILDSSIRWSKAPPMISFFTLLIRLGMSRESGDSLEKTFRKIKLCKKKGYFDDGTNQDRLQTRRAEKGIKYIIKHGDRKVFFSDVKKNYPPLGIPIEPNKFVTVATIHNKTGIVAFSQRTTQNLFPRWHRFEEVV